MSVSHWRQPVPPAFWHAWVPPRLHRVVRWAAWLAAAGTLIGFSLVVVYALLASRFDMEQAARPPTGTRVLDRNGEEFAMPGARARPLLRREDVPPFLVDALRAREDARFYEHRGVDLRGLTRAFWRNLRDRRFTQGASTLSMQLARNVFGLKQKSIDRKLLEIAVTLRLESRFTKDEILTHYLNTIYFGAGAVGLEQAAQTYFGKSARDLSNGECALVVGIIRGPHVFSPFRNLPAALEQREQTLDRLVAMGLIDRLERDRLAAEPVRLVPESRRATQSSHALQAVRRELDWLLEQLGAAPTGLTVHTTLDAGWQNRLERELALVMARLESDPAWPHPTHAAHPAATEAAYLQCAAVTTEIRTGDILALIGGRDFGHSSFDRSRSSRDLGPVFELIVAAAAADADRPVRSGQPVQTGRSAGPAAVARVARRCGLNGRLADTEDLYRGAAAATPWELSVALATLANDGQRPTASLIREVRDASGTSIFQARPRLVPAVRPAAATAALQVMRSSGSTRTLVGATASERDAWMLRLGPTGATALWLGFDKPVPITTEPRLRALLEEIVRRLQNRQ
jgi:penicillin-binding protein 1A